MPYVTLTSGAYSARSVIANAQRCVNLYPESAPPESKPPVPVTHYPTPGLRLLAQGPFAPVRGLYTATNGDLYAAIGDGIYYVTSAWTMTRLGTIMAGTSPVVMADNGTTILVVDGTQAGYTIELDTRLMAKIEDEAFYGADRVGYLDTFFVLNKSGSGQFYCSGSNDTSFDGLDIASKTGAPDKILTIAVVHSEVRLLGTRTTEVWSTSGSADFPFAPLPGAFIDHGCIAKHSVARIGPTLLWLAQDEQGRGFVLAEAGYKATRVSTHAIEHDLQGYSRLDDAVAFCYQQEGHGFYVLNFPEADKTWVFDLETKQWHERTWIDADGKEHRHRANCYALAYDTGVVGDRENGKIYALSLDAYDDAGDPIVRRRGFPHFGTNGNRNAYTDFLVDLEVGTTPNVPASAPAQLSLRYSDTRGASWGNPVTLPMGASGEHSRVVKFTRLGMARDRVFEVFWSSPVRTALNGVVVGTAAGSS